LGRVLTVIAKPLGFEAANDFAALGQVKNLESTVASAAARARQLAIPPDVRLVLAGIEERFATALEGDRRRTAVAAALDALAPLLAAGFADHVLARPIATLPGVGPKRADALAKRGLRTVVDLLFHLPTRYDDRRSRVKIGDLEVGARATFIGEVLVADTVPLRGRAPRMFQAVLGDETGTVLLKWFRGGDSMKNQLKKGVRLRATGDVRRYRFDREVIHPEIDILRESADGDEPEDTPALVPDYPVPEGLPPRTFRNWVALAVENFTDLVPSTLPADLVRELRLPDTPTALRAIHGPAPDDDPEALRERRTPAHLRLVLEELYLLELGLALRRAARAKEPGIPLRGDGRKLAAALEALPFALTSAQHRAWEEIHRDLQGSAPMSRLLQGDVGSGKTVVAALGAVAAAEAGCQTALMAPTELLAEQHLRTLDGLLAGAKDLRRELLTASVPRAEARRIREGLAVGEVDLVVGTHALVQADVRFARLGLVVVDEQHRFGVMQRAALAEKSAGGAQPHTLVMTATPIPRSLALTLYGDLDLSVIDEMPPGRTPVETLLVRSGEGAQVTRLVRETVERGEQVYVVYPLVEESEKVDLRAATESAERIRAAFAGVPVELVHGRLDAAERAGAMERFGSGATRILISTTVIEVGVDIPNATLMVVEHAERFGLAQLHQLRGRVGRGERPGTCVLVARGSTEDSEARLRAMLETTDGFRIADADLRIRGPGEFLGTRQSGRMPDLRFADLVRDARLVARAREAARATVDADPGLREQPALATAVATRWGERLKFVGIG
jgi:ATP-dependent DNA helicase RecG